MIRGRWASSSCVLAEYVYTFAGHQGQYINSIEKLKVKGAPGPESSAWQAIPPSSSFTPRAWPVVCPLNDFEIVIIGGDIQDGYQCFNDIFIFEVGTGRCKKVGEGG